MDWALWIPALSTTGLLACAWLIRAVINARLSKTIQHEFDTRLEELRAELRYSEESFKADLRSKENQIGALRGGALAALASRQAALDQRRLEAVDQIWSAVNELAQGKNASKLLAGLKVDAVRKEAAKNPKMREVIASFSLPIETVKTGGEAHKARPFVSAIVWALFSAYQSIVLIAVTQIHMMKAGIEVDFLDHDAIKKLIAVALPHQTKFIADHGVFVSGLLLDELETRLLEELKHMLDGIESDKATIDQAAAIMREAENTLATVSAVGAI